MTQEQIRHDFEQDHPNIHPLLEWDGSQYISHTTGDVTDLAADINAALDIYRKAHARYAGGGPEPVDWSLFPSYLIDNCEGDIISEEGLQSALAGMLKDKRYTRPVGYAGGGEAEWSGWACQYPGKMPSLYGAREIAEVNWYPEDGDRLLFLSTHPAPAVPDGLLDLLNAVGHHGSDFGQGEFQIGRDEVQKAQELYTMLTASKEGK